jgi:hypothetical protein
MPTSQLPFPPKLANADVPSVVALGTWLNVRNTIKATTMRIVAAMAEGEACYCAPAGELRERV